MTRKLASYLVFVVSLLAILGSLYVGLGPQEEKDPVPQYVEFEGFRLEGEKNMRLKSEESFELFFKFGEDGKEILGETEYIVPDHNLIELKSAYLIYMGKMYVYSDWSCGFRHNEGDGFDFGVGTGTSCTYMFVLYDPESK